MSFDWDKVRESKDAYRRKLAAKPIAEKLRMLDVMRERELAIRGSGSSPEPRVPKAELRKNETTIGEVTEARVEQCRPKGHDFTYIDISSIDRETKRIVDQKILPVTKAPSRARQLLRRGDVLVSMTRPNLNAVALVPSNLDGAIGSTGFHVLRARNAEPGFLYYAVQSPGFIDAMCRKIQGALYPAVRPKDISSFILPTFSLAEQQRIVAEIEKQFTRLDAGVGSLKRVQVALKQYRSSALKAACEGDWPAIQLSEIAEVVTGSTPPTADARSYGDALPFFKPTDLNAGYNVREARQRLSSSGAKLARRLPERSILVTCIGATIGKTGLARTGCATNQQINAVIVDQSRANPEWLFWVLTSPYGQHQIKSNASATTLPILNKGRFEKLNIPLPPLADQERIVAEIERRLSVVEEVEAVVSANLQRATRLRQSILSLAFAGRLTTK